MARPRTTRRRVDGVVLAGGRSTRFGSDKRVVAIDGEPLVARAVRKLAQVTGGTLFVATGARRERLPGTARAVPIIDVPPGCGPLGGILAALERARSGVLALACDLPNVRVTTLARVLRTGFGGERPVAIRSRHGWEPLVAYWPRSVYKDVYGAVGAGLLAPHKLLARLGAVAVEGVDEWELVNVNRPSDLELVEERTRR